MILCEICHKEKPPRAFRTRHVQVCNFCETEIEKETGEVDEAVEAHIQNQLLTPKEKHLVLSTLIRRNSDITNQLKANRRITDTNLRSMMNSLLEREQKSLRALIKKLKGAK